MPLLRRGPLVTTTIALYGGSRAAVSFDPAPERWPEHEGSDRLAIPLGLAALALARADETVARRVRPRLMGVAAALAGDEASSADAESRTEAVAGLALVEPEGPGQPRIVLKLTRSPVGPVPSLGRAAPSPLAVAAAAAAVIAAFLGEADGDLRLASALTLEGVLGWYREADPHFQPPQQAVAYSLRYAASRLEEAARPVPADLTRSVAEHRRITPMAGGA
jgi:inactivated superfamily I helicase